MILILAYHSVGKMSYEHTIPSWRFWLQMFLINSLARPIALSSLGSVLSSHKGSCYVIVTFDDGLRDNFTEARPILKRLGIPGHIFIATKFIDTWHSNPRIPHPFPMLTSSDIKTLSSEGLISIGSHTHTHPCLDELSDLMIYEELQTSKNILENIVKQPVYSLAYPKGRFNVNVQNVARTLYSVSFGGTGAILETTNIDISAIPRVVISRFVPTWKFVCMLFPLYWRIKILFKYND